MKGFIKEDLDTLVSIFVVITFASRRVPFCVRSQTGGLILVGPEFAEWAKFSKFSIPVLWIKQRLEPSPFEAQECKLLCKFRKD